MTGNEMMAAIVRASVHTFIGRIGRDPDVKFFENGNAVANCRMAVNRPGAKRDDGQEPDWFKLELWGEKAQAFADGVTKGDLVVVVGRVKSEKWTDRNSGEDRSGLAVVVERWEHVVLPPRAPAAPSAPAAPAASAATARPSADDEIPF